MFDAGEGWAPFLPHFLCPLAPHYQYSCPFLTSQLFVAARMPKTTTHSGPKVLLGGTPLSLLLCLLFRVCDTFIANRNQSGE